MNKLEFRKENLEKLASEFFDKNGHIIRNYQIEFLSNPDYYRPGSKTVLGAGTSSGKTEMAIAYLSIFYSFPENKRKKTLILPASQSVLRDNFSDRLQHANLLRKFKFHTLTHETSNSEIEFLFSEDGPQVIVALPQILNRRLHLLRHVHNFILDEAHEWYFIKRKKDLSQNGTVDKILDKISPVNQLLLTGTPFIFTQKNKISEDFKIFYVPPLELYERGFISNIKLEIVTSTISYNADSYESRPYGELKKSIQSSFEEDRDSLEEVCKKMIEKLKDPTKSWPDFQRISGGSLSVFGSLKKTLILCRSISQAENFFQILEKNRLLKGKVLVSHSDSDPNSSYFKDFQTNPDFLILIVVDRARLGYNDPNLCYVVDFTYSQNLVILLQILGRIFRLPTNQKNYQKIYFKVAPRGHTSYFEDIMTAVFCLLNRKWYEKFDLNNMGDIRIPKISKSRKNIGSSSNKSININGKKISRKDVREQLHIPLDLEFFKDVFHKDSDAFATVSWTTLEDSRRAFLGLHFINQEQKDEIVKIYQGDPGISLAEIARRMNIGTTTVGKVLSKMDFYTVKKPPSKEEIQKRDLSIADHYSKNQGIKLKDLSSKFSLSEVKISGILRKFGLIKEKSTKEFLNQRNSRILEIWKENPQMNSIEIARQINSEYNIIISSNTVNRILHNFPTFSSKHLNKYQREERKIKCIQLHLENPNLTLSEIAEKLHSSAPWVSKTLQENGFKSKHQNIEESKNNMIEYKIKNPKTSIQALAEKFGLSSPTVSDLLKEKGIKHKRPWKDPSKLR